ncbi:Imm53 family immunity protein [Streptomyces sp. NPDC002851]
MDNPELISRLDDWYADQCDGDWEHEFGMLDSALKNVLGILGGPVKGTEPAVPG